MRLRIRVHAVGLEQLRLVGDAFEHEGHERRLPFLRQLAVHAIKLLAIGAAIVGWHAHAHQHHLRARFFGCLTHGAQIRFGGRHGQAAQAVVGAQFDQHDVGLVFGQQGGQARAAAAGGLAADAGVDDARVVLLRGQPLFQQRHPARAPCQTIFGREAVAEHQQRFWCRIGVRHA